MNKWTSVGEKKAFPYRIPTNSLEEIQVRRSTSCNHPNNNWFSQESLMDAKFEWKFGEEREIIYIHTHTITHTHMHTYIHTHIYAHIYMHTHIKSQNISHKLLINNKEKNSNFTVESYLQILP